MQMIEFIGYLGSLAAASCSLPQLIKMFRTKQVRDVSIWWGIILMFATICWIIYGLANHLMPVIVCNVVILVQAILLVVLKMKWSKS